MYCKNPNLRLIPAWDQQPPPPSLPAADTAINDQMDQLHALSDMVFIATIVLDLVIGLLCIGFYDRLSFGGIVALAVTIGTIGAMGCLVMWRLNHIETKVRKLNNPNKEDENV